MYILQFLLKGSDDTLADLTLDELEELLQEGPTRDAHCIACGNFTTGDKCEECIPGTFRGSEDYRSPCRPYVSVFFVSCIMTSVKYRWFHKLCILLLHKSIFTSVGFVLPPNHFSYLNSQARNQKLCIKEQDILNTVLMDRHTCIKLKIKLFYASVIFHDGVHI
jgi:hypothetical protein